jgi:hypothetical protein
MILAFAFQSPYSGLRLHEGRNRGVHERFVRGTRRQRNPSQLRCGKGCNKQEASRMKQENKYGPQFVIVLAVVVVGCVQPGPVWTPLVAASFPDEKLKTFGEK